MTKSSTHPDNAFGSQDAISIEDFNRTITDAYYREHHSTSKKQPFREVRVLCFHFDTGNGGAYCDKVKDVFSQGFGFRVATCRLPCTDTAQREMITALEEAFDGMDSDCLVIIYYIGHSVNKHDHLGNMHFWMEGEQTGQKPPEVNFNLVQDMCIHHQPAKVLTLFDTIFRVEDGVYSATSIRNAAGESVSKYKEIIGGFYENYRETPRGTECFTEHLVDVLTQAAFAKNFLTTAQLWTNLARRYVTANNMELGNMPWFIAEFEENQAPISIKPMKSSDWSSAPSPCFVGSSQEIKALLSVHLENLGQQTDWDIRGRVEQNPLIARCPRVHNVYRSSPFTGILIVSITLQV